MDDIPKVPKRSTRAPDMGSGVDGVKNDIGQQQGGKGSESNEKSDNKGVSEEGVDTTSTPQDEGGAGEEFDSQKDPVSEFDEDPTSELDEDVTSELDKEDPSSELDDAPDTDAGDGELDKRSQMELDAANAILEVAPGASEVNQGRKGLKDFNKAKKDMGMKEGATDEIDSEIDNTLIKGVRGLEREAAMSGAKLGAAGIAGGQAATTTSNLVGGAKAMAANAASKLTFGNAAKAVWGSIKSGVSNAASATWGAIQGGASHLASGAMALGSKALSGVTGLVGSATSTVSSTLGIGVAASKAVVGTALSGTLLFSSVFGVLGFNELLGNRKDTGYGACIPELTSVARADVEYKYDGETEAARQEVQQKIYSVLSEYGAADETIAGMIGNFQIESGNDPTTIETIYNEDFEIGSRKQKAISNSFLMSYLDPGYNARFPNIITAGTGLMQWTDTRDGSRRQTMLLAYADDSGLDWFDTDLQLMFMLDGDDQWSRNNLNRIINGTIGNVDAETKELMHKWVINKNSTLGARQDYARKALLDIRTYEVDKDYADSILSGLNVDKSKGNRAAGSYHQDDGCGNALKDYYGNKSADGTGEIPAGLKGRAWKPADFPDKLKEFYADPKDAGLSYGNASGWANNIYADQCAALSSSYFMLIYPDWNKDGRSKERAKGDGGVLTGNWAKHYGEKTTTTPASGAMFSDTTTSVYGHTGIVQHVFANGDLLIVEQNVPGLSGAGAGLNYSWSWRLIDKESYVAKKWVFFKPSGYEPQWNGKK